VASNRLLKKQLASKGFYDLEKAIKVGLKPDPVSGHWGSRDPISGASLKVPGHPTLSLAVKEDKALGYNNVLRGTRLYSFKKSDPRLQGGSVNTPRSRDISGALFSSELEKAIRSDKAPRSKKRRWEREGF